ncbi:MAG: hypothetical protein EBY17_30020, partial [Acidobacteriia bacterium]|nr:hypothetical protein [Terriglobia bacterium]
EFLARITSVRDEIQNLPAPVWSASSNRESIVAIEARWNDLQAQCEAVNRLYREAAQNPAWVRLKTVRDYLLQYDLLAGVREVQAFQADLQATRDDYDRMQALWTNFKPLELVLNDRLEAQYQTCQAAQAALTDRLQALDPARYENVYTQYQKVVANYQTYISSHDQLQKRFEEIKKRAKRDFPLIATDTAYWELFKMGPASAAELRREITLIRTQFDNWDRRVEALVAPLINIQPVLEADLNQLRQKLQACEREMQTQYEALRERNVPDLEQLQQPSTFEKTYRKLSLQYHPDKANDPQATEITKILNHLQNLERQKHKPLLTALQDKEKHLKTVVVSRFRSLGNPEHYAERVAQVLSKLEAEVQVYQGLVATLTAAQQRFRESLADLQRQRDAILAAWQRENSQLAAQHQRYKQQLAEVRKVMAQGLLSAKEADTARTYLQRLDTTLAQVPSYSYTGLDLPEREPLLVYLQRVEKDLRRKVEAWHASVRRDLYDLVALSLQAENRDLYSKKPLWERVWSSVTGEQAALLSAQIYEKSGQSLGQPYESALTEHRRQLLLRSVGVLGLTTLVVYMYWRGQYYWRRRKLWQKLKTITPRKMWIVIEPYARSTRTPEALPASP